MAALSMVWRAAAVVEVVVAAADAGVAAVSCRRVGLVDETSRLLRPHFLESF